MKAKYSGEEGKQLIFCRYSVKSEKHLMVYSATVQLLTHIN